MPNSLLEQQNQELQQALTALKTISNALTQNLDHPNAQHSDVQSLATSVDQLQKIIVERNQMFQDVLMELEQSNHELKLAKLAAESSNDAKSKFLANMSHEIRTPLTAIIGFSETLISEELDKTDRLEATRCINRSGKHLLGVINDILDLSKIEANKLDIEQISVDIFEIFADVEALSKFQAQEKGLSFHFNYEFPLPRSIYSDPVRLKQILFNLTNNAIKFTHEGGVRVRVKYCMDLNQLIIDVIDTGIGMNNYQQEKLFQPFMQGDISTTRRFGGTGLGLALSKTLANKLHGDISVTSTEDVGSIFTLNLRTADSAQLQLINDLSATHPQTEIPKSTAKYDQCHGTILLVDDSEDNQKLISLYLRRLGNTVLVAANGLQALKLAFEQDTKIDLILMDFQMPVMDGVEATGLLRAKGFNKPIIALTANVGAGDSQTYTEMGFNDYIGKPIIREIFNEKIQKYLAVQTKPDIQTSLFCDADPEFVELARGFLDKLPNHTLELIHNQDQQKWQALRENLHRLKGVSGNFGFHGLEKLLDGAETLVLDGRYQQLAEKMIEIVQESQRLVEVSKQSGNRSECQLIG